VWRAIVVIRNAELAIDTKRDRLLLRDYLEVIR